ncbi:MAG: hypothetical protein P0Y56_05080 [Candidatus Andeanibacterium colombiense]|uniref:Uncharacterized protein n=1 Tax=Candidatus Andeanibacterium colombiense TaxID=3121345 RepID=A0AAJ5X7C3_9SPHN|nr:MAG: hypothetical protein P0Y56_05080 [Sphingomonadaceae bacterium]
MGQIVGGTFGVFLLYVIWEYVLFKRIMDDPVRGKLLSVMAAYLTASVVYGFASARGGPFNPAGFIAYALGAVVVGFFAVRRGVRLKDEMGSEDEVTQTFR